MSQKISLTGSYSPGWYFFLVVICLIFTYGPLFNFVTNLSVQWKFFFVTLIIPIFLAVIQSITVTQKTDHAIVTMDRFDDLLNKRLDHFRTKQKKVIIFVDDLDRVTPGMARDVLDNLRTFFDKKEITFVVTGDQTVLEGYLGRDLLPDSLLPEQLEEGRRFLKKIFNVYWRLPLPIKKDIDAFITGEFGKHTEALQEFFSDDAQKTKFSNYLSKYFESNFRQIIRFIDTTLFTFQIVKQKSEDTDQKRAAYFKEMLKNPLFVVRILVIQELCAPLFDKIVVDPEILRTLEYAVEKKDTSQINEVVEKNKADLSFSQQNFLKRFIYEEPHFYNGSNLKVLDLQPYLSLAADTSFGDQRGPSSEDFMEAIRTGDPVQVRAHLSSMGPTRATDGVTGFITQLAPSVAEPTKVNFLKTLLMALVDLPSEVPTHKIFAEKLAPTDYSFLNNIAPNPKMEILNIFWQWLDSFNDDTVSGLFKLKFSSIDLDQFNSIKMENAGSFKSYFIANWLKDYYGRNSIEALNLMIDRFSKLKIEKIQEEIGLIKTSLIDNLVQDPNVEARKNRYIIIKNYVKDGDNLLKTKIFDEISALNQEITSWAILKSDEKDAPWKRVDIEERILVKIDAAQDFSILNQALKFLVTNKLGSPEIVWPKILPKHTVILVDNFPQIINDASFQIIAPPQAYANELMDALIAKIEKLESIQQAQWLDYAVKGKWLWINLEKYPLGKRLANLKKSKDEQVKKNLDIAEDSWKEITKEEK